MCEASKNYQVSGRGCIKSLVKSVSMARRTVGCNRWGVSSKGGGREFEGEGEE